MAGVWRRTGGMGSVGRHDRCVRRCPPWTPADHRSRRETRGRPGPALGGGHVRPPSLGAGRGAGRGCVMRDPVHGRVLQALARGVRARRAGRAAQRRAGDGRGELPLRPPGRPHRLEGVVVRGDRRGKEIGFPTANLLTRPDAAVPADGVYAAWLVRDVQRLPAAVSIGTNPTFSGRERRVEAYVLDFDDDLYGERVALDFVERLRDMQRYSGVEPLIAQIREDIVRTREVLSL